MSNERTHRLIPAVWVILTRDDGKIFLLQRLNTGWEDGKYTVPCGHIEYMESPTQAGSRELLEEACVNAKPADFKHVLTLFNKSNDVTDTERVNVFFVVDTFGGDAKIGEPDKASDCGWYSLEELPPLASTLSYGLQCIARGEAYSELYY